MTQRNLAVVTAGLSQPSSTRLLADRLATATREELVRQGADVVIDVIELREYAQDLTNTLLTGFANPRLQDVFTKVRNADGVITVTPIFSASYSGLFKTFFDALEADVVAGKPVLIAATAGTARHSLALEFALRPLFAYLKAVVVPTAVFAAADDWGAGGDAKLADRIARAAGELAELMTASEHRAPADPFDDVTPFDRLLSDG